MEEKEEKRKILRSWDTSCSKQFEHCHKKASLRDSFIAFEEIEERRETREIGNVAFKRVIQLVTAIRFTL